MRNLWYQSDNKKPLLIGHRGASHDAPENSMHAFSLAAEQAAHGIEFDVQLSADGIPVIIHDLTVDRTTNGSGLVSELTVAQLQQLDVGDQQGVPTLDQLFSTFGSRFLYNVELKQTGWIDHGLETAVAICIEKHQLAEQTVISCFNPWALRRMKRCKPIAALTALLWDQLYERYQFYITGGEAVHPNHQHITHSYMLWAKKQQLLVNSWTIDQPEEAKRLHDLGVCGIITNKPNLLKDFFN